MRDPREDQRVDEDDVRHHDERRGAGHRVPRERRPTRGKAEVALQEALASERRGDRAHLCCVLPWTCWTTRAVKLKSSPGRIKTPADESPHFATKSRDPE